MFENDLIQTLEQGSNLTVEWFRKNNMIVNTTSFRPCCFKKTIIINKAIDCRQLTDSVKLLRNKIDDKLNFEEHISNLT